MLVADAVFLHAPLQLARLFQPSHRSLTRNLISGRLRNLKEVIDLYDEKWYFPFKHTFFFRAHKKEIETTRICIDFFTIQDLNNCIAKEHSE